MLNCINCNPVPRGTRNHPDEASEKFASFQTDSGLQLDLEIALSGVSAKMQPYGLLQPGPKDALKRRVMQLGCLYGVRENLSSISFVNHCRAMSYAIGMLFCRLRIKQESKTQWTPYHY